MNCTRESIGVLLNIAIVLVKNRGTTASLIAGIYTSVRTVESTNSLSLSAVDMAILHKF